MCFTFQVKINGNTSDVRRNHNNTVPAARSSTDSDKNVEDRKKDPETEDVDSSSASWVDADFDASEHIIN